jgi:hypothetical protein
MSPKDSIPAFLSLRALLVIAALICLCVSSNVGPQLFPLPAATTQAPLDVQLEQANKASHAPRADAQSFRVPMMAQSKKRAEKEPPQSDPLIVLPSERFGLPTDTRAAIETGYHVCFLTSVTMAPRAGRAPPSLV